MDEVSKFRLIGAAIWLSLLILIVPGWYSNPVNFQPEGARSDTVEQSVPLVQQAYVLPGKGREEKAAEPIQSPQASAVAPAVKTESEQAEGMATIEKGQQAAAVQSGESEPKSQWLLKVAAYKKLSNANKVLGMLDRDYEVWIKEFPVSKTFSVRTGPYDSREAALRDKQKIDRALHTQSQIVQVK
ncbi:SPOR domain-containing protein [Thiomicrorhabdus chilensis]|uniref:SPOR domain-containing protein n=1 Tax=Thiomicrorhabdus chilensis TaxID=63656 RepID=UPI0003FD081E|nr:SPOR domain-containing protein [Thiomicrorhabdus chilensis]